MKKIILLVALLALPSMALASGGLVGDCYDCHTMHNSENGVPVAVVNGAVTGAPIENLLKMDCIACHANDPTGGTKLMTLSGGTVVPQVAHGSADDLAGGNFTFGLGDSSKVHNVVDLFAGQWDTNGGDPADLAEFGAPPGTAPAAHYHGLSRAVFTTDLATPFDAFTCAGARGCHGTRSQSLSGATADWDGNASTANTFEGTRRTGLAAVSGAHHNSYDGVKESDGYNAALADGALHNGQIVADGYRFIPGLFGYGNEVTRWENVSASEHNEYYGQDGGFTADGGGCGACHIEGHTGAIGGSSRAAFASTLKTPNNSMSGFCSTCHGKFHSAGGVNAADYVNNGVSGAFLRHPSDFVIPNSGEYAAYTTYDLSAPVARPSITGLTASSDVVTPGTDMVMCLSCHEAHGSANDYILRFDYTAMTAGFYGDVATAQGTGGCLACHTTKGVLPENR